MNKDARILITGHTGLIGSAFVRRLQRDGYQNLLLPSHQELDLTDNDAVMGYFDVHRPAIVIQAAGKVGGILENKTYPADFINTNLAIQLNVFTNAHKYDVRKLIFFASSCMYPRECSQPMPESALMSGPMEPTSIAYAVSKLAGMQMCLAYNQQYKEQRFIPVIPNSAYGPFDNFNPDFGHVLSALIRRFHEATITDADSVTLWGTGSPCREFIHADDIADACLFLLNKEAGFELPVNIGSGTDYSIKNLAQKIAALTSYNGTISWDTSKPDGSPRKLLDISRLQSLGWTPKVDFEDGLKETYNWYCEQLSTAV
jgi:GDP-L-fucose synthase